MHDKSTRNRLSKAAEQRAKASRSVAGQATITLRLTRADTKPIERVKRWEQRSAARVKSLTD